MPDTARSRKEDVGGECIPLAISKRADACWQVTFDNPPLNLIDPETSIALRAPPRRGPREETRAFYGRDARVRRSGLVPSPTKVRRVLKEIS
jgi:hypothetical protein